MPAEQPLPPEVRPVPPPRRDFLWTALSVPGVLTIAFMALIFAANAAEEAFGSHPHPAEAAFQAAAAAGLAWLCLRGVRKLVRVHRGQAPGYGPGIAVLWIVGGFGSCWAPRLVEFQRVADDGANLGNLGALRSGLDFYRRQDGRYPSSLEALADPRLMASPLPLARIRAHRKSPFVTYGAKPDDAGGWLYDNAPENAGFGTLRINCTHTDLRGSAWSAY